MFLSEVVQVYNQSEIFQFQGPKKDPTLHNGTNEVAWGYWNNKTIDLKIHLFFNFLCEFLRDLSFKYQLYFILFLFCRKKRFSVCMSSDEKIGKLLCGRLNTIICHRYWINGYCNKPIVDEVHTKNILRNWKNNRDKSMPASIIGKKNLFPFTCRLLLDNWGLPSYCFSINTRFSKITKMSFKIPSKIF